MTRLTKAQRAMQPLVNRQTLYSLEEAVRILKKISLEVRKGKFTESVDVDVCLGVNASKSDQVVRGSTVLPKGLGKTLRVAVFAQEPAAEEARVAGADIVGFDDLAANIKSGELNFDVLIATPAAMRVVGALGTILGPRGLMPNPKAGTVTDNIAVAVRNAKSGQLRYRSDKGGVIHGKIGNINFSADELRENIAALMADLRKLKPAAAKGVYFRKVVLSTTMGPGLKLDIAPFVS